MKYQNFRNRTNFKLKTVINLFSLAILLAFLVPYVTARWDPYEIIGVSRGATLEQIKKAYRESAKKLHPDKTNLSGEQANRKFIELSKAFNILKDPSKRSRHDKHEGNRLFEKLLRRFSDLFWHWTHFVSSLQSFQLVIITLTCAILTVIFIYRSSKSSCFPRSHPSNNQQYQDVSKNATNLINPAKAFPSNLCSTEDLKVLELKAETYNGMIRLLKPGHRTIIVLVDIESKEILTSHFKKAVWPYRRNKTLLFGYLDLDKNLAWYQSLLEEVLGFEQLVINKKRCLGTVLSINGFKRYFRVYHVRHHEGGCSEIDGDDCEGSFLSFSEDDPECGILSASDVKHCEQSPNSHTYSVDSLLDRLPIWLDKMFDGMTKRYFIDDWPGNIR